MRPEFINRYAASVPRYTSYPTAPNFQVDFGAGRYADWLAAVPDDAPLSLYLHIPFCETLCWYCGCATKMVKQYDPVAAYLHALTNEIRTVTDILGSGRRVSHIHWGGGSPNILAPNDIHHLSTTVFDHFDVQPDAEFSVEIDPRKFEPGKIAAFVDAGVTRVSLGVQDFDEKVQLAINRVQSFADTKRAIDAFRDGGVRSVNIDLVYGLPFQTRASLAKTVGQVIDLDVDRIAVFGYAHLPSKIAHQRKIPDAALPNSVERFAQSNRAANLLLHAGYKRVGLDHFAKTEDRLVATPVKRNFQGYTADDAQHLIGFGASAIGSLPQGYVQNAVSTGEYIRRVRDLGLATSKGCELTDEDRARALVINRLMCDLEFPADELRASHADHFNSLLDEAHALVEADEHDLVEGTCDGLRVTEKGRPFVRSICACFDAYLGETPALFSAGV